MGNLINDPNYDGGKPRSISQVDKSPSEQGSGILSTRGTVDNRQHELEQLVVKRVREATAVINAYTQKLVTEGSLATLEKVWPLEPAEGRITTDHWEGYKMALRDMSDRCEAVRDSLSQPARDGDAA